MAHRLLRAARILVAQAWSRAWATTLAFHPADVPRVALHMIILVASFALGATVVIAGLDAGTVRLEGGLSPGWLLRVGMIGAIVAVLLRFALGRRVFRRIWGAIFSPAGLGGLAAAGLRAALAGGAAAALAITAMNPVRSDRVYIVLDEGGPGIKRYPEAMNDELRTTAALFGPGYDVRFDSPAVETLARSKDNDWRALQEAQRRLPPLDERLGLIDDALAGRVGDRVIVLSERPGDRLLRNYPLDASRIMCRWVVVGNAANDDPERPEFTFLEIGADPAVAPTFRLALRGNIQPPDLSLELWDANQRVAGPFTLRPNPTPTAGAAAPSPIDAHFGRLGGILQYECTLPRIGAELRVSINDPTWLQAAARVPDLGDGVFQLRNRSATVAAPAALASLTALPTFVEDAPPAPGTTPRGVPLRFVQQGAAADASWTLRGSAPLPSGPVVEIVESKAAWSARRGMRLSRTAEYSATDLGAVWLTPAWAAGWPDLGEGLSIGPATRVLARSRGPSGDGAPILHLPDPSRPNHVVLVVPRLKDVPTLPAEQRRGLEQLLIIATSLATRDGRSEPALVQRLFTSDDSLQTLAETGPQAPSHLASQMWEIFLGAHDHKPHATPRNSARTLTIGISLASVGVLGALAVLASIRQLLRRIRP